MRTAVRLAQRLEFRKFGVELALDIGLLQKVPLHFAAGGLGDALGRYDLRDLEAGVFVDEPTDRCRGRQEIRHVAAVEHEHDQFLALRARLRDAGGDHLVEFEAGCALCDVLQIVRIVVLAVDEDDFLGAAGDVQAGFVNDTKIAGVDPTVGVDRRAEAAGSAK